MDYEPEPVNNLLIHIVLKRIFQTILDENPERIKSELYPFAKIIVAILIISFINELIYRFGQV